MGWIQGIIDLLSAVWGTGSCASGPAPVSVTRHLGDAVTATSSHGQVIEWAIGISLLTTLLVVILSCLHRAVAGR